MNLSVVILAAGLGTRMKSKRAKVLHRAGGLTLIEQVVATAKQLQPERIVAVVGHQAEQVEAALEGSGVEFAHQAEQKGTADALLSSRDLLANQGGLVLVLYGDVPLLSAGTLQHLIESQKKNGPAATILTTELEDPTGYGRIIADALGNVQAIVEQKAGTLDQLALCRVNSGIYCFQSELLWQYLAEISPHPASGEYYLTDVVEVLHRAGHTVRALDMEEWSELLGINTRLELAACDRVFRDRKVREMMLAGVTIEKPETVTIDNGVEIGEDTLIEPFAQLLGKTKIGKDCRIGASSIIQDSELADGVDVGPFTMIAASRADAGAHLGPYARIRMNTHIERDAFVGNFVELKKTRLGAGAKAQHLAYLGDADIGEKVNIGAGTITCNYDGHEKHATKIGAGAFVGSNSTLVAPVEVGEGSYIGAASIITKHVPADSLAVGRAHQVVKEGWAATRREQRKASPKP